MRKQEDYKKGIKRTSEGKIISKKYTPRPQQPIQKRTTPKNVIKGDLPQEAKDYIKNQGTPTQTPTQQTQVQQPVQNQAQPKENMTQLQQVNQTLGNKETQDRVKWAALGIAGPAVAGLGTIKVLGKSNLVTKAVSKISSLGRSLLGAEATAAPNIAKAATGKITSEAARDLAGGFPSATTVINKVPVNTKTGGKMLKYLTTLAKKSKRPEVVIGLLGVGLYTSLFWGPNEKGDAMTSLSIAQAAALREKDYGAVLEIAEDIEEANNIKARVPVMGFTQAEEAKFDATVKASETYSGIALREMASSEQRSINAEVTGQPARESQPKWIQTSEGKWKPNFDNPLWVKEDGRNVWKGD